MVLRFTLLMNNNPLQPVNMLPITYLHSWDLQMVTQMLKRSWQKDWSIWAFMQVLILIHTLMLSHPLVLSYPLALSLALIHVHMHNFHVQDLIANHPNPVGDAEDLLPRMREWDGISMMNC